MNRPKIKDYKTISGPGAYDYVADMNIYIDQLEIRLKNKDDFYIKLINEGKTRYITKT